MLFYSLEKLGIILSSGYHGYIYPYPYLYLDYSISHDTEFTFSFWKSYIYHMNNKGSSLFCSLVL